MDNIMTHKSITLNAICGNSDSISQSISIDIFANGGIAIPTGSGITSLSFYVSSNGITYYPAYDTTNTQITTTVAAGRSYPLPSAVFGHRFLMIITNSSTPEHLDITLKS